MEISGFTAFDADDLLAPRINHECMPRWKLGFHVDAAREAFVIVERALKEKGRLTNNKLFGRRLIQSIFKNSSVYVKVPLAEQGQEFAQSYFDAVFSYYRNYVMHDGRSIDAKISARIMIIASELLELLDASQLTLGQHGGIEGLLRVVGCVDKEQFTELLLIVDGFCTTDWTFDGLFQEIALKGFEDFQFEALFELGLVEISTSPLQDIEMNSRFRDDAMSFEVLSLTELGRSVVSLAKGDK